MSATPEEPKKVKRSKKPKGLTKSEIITFKADPSLLEAMKTIPNRSEFIRSAVMMALESTCPLCGGSGILTPHQREHWDDFKQDHTLNECTDCREYHLVCGHKKAQ